METPDVFSQEIVKNLSAYNFEEWADVAKSIESVIILVLDTTPIDDVNTLNMFLAVINKSIRDYSLKSR